MSGLGERIYMDREGQREGEKRKKKKCWRYRTFGFYFMMFWFFFILVTHIVTFTPVLPYGGLDMTVGVVGILIMILFLAYWARAGKKQLTKEIKPLTVYENGIAFTNWYLKYRAIDIISHRSFKFDEIKEVKEEQHPKVSALSNIYIYTKDQDYGILLRHFLCSDHEKFFQILEEKGVRVRRRKESSGFGLI